MEFFEAVTRAGFEPTGANKALAAGYPAYSNKIDALFADLNEAVAKCAPWPILEGIASEIHDQDQIAAWWMDQLEEGAAV